MTITILYSVRRCCCLTGPRGRGPLRPHTVFALCWYVQWEREKECVSVCERIEIVSSRWTALYYCCTGSGTGEKDGVSRHRAFIFTAGYSHCRRTKPSPEHPPSHPRINQNSLVPPSSNRHHTRHHLHITFICYYNSSTYIYIYLNESASHGF